MEILQTTTSRLNIYIGLLSRVMRYRMTEKPASQSRIRFKLLDGLRLLAALAVVSYHFLGYEHMKWGVSNVEAFPHLSKLAAYGALGVQLFFIVSGFVILMSSWGRSIPQFVASRVSRLFPAYWAGVIATSVLFVFVTSGDIKNISLSDFLVNLTMFQSAVGVENVDGVYWTLWIELLFYLVIGFFMSRNPSRVKLMAFIFLWPVVGAIAERGKFELFTILLSPQYAPLFAGGMALYLIHAYGHSLVHWLLVIFNMVLAAQQTVAGFFTRSMISDTKQELSPTVCVIVIISMFILVALFTVSPIRGWGPNWLTYAGALTYPLYLLHEHWGWWIISWASPAYGHWVALFMALAFAILCAILIERFVERRLHPVIMDHVRRGLGGADASRKAVKPVVSSSGRQDASVTLDGVSGHSN